MNNLILLAISLLGITVYKILGYPVSDWIIVLTAIVFMFYLMIIDKPSIVVAPPLFSLMLFFVFMFYLGAMISSYNSSNVIKSVINSQRILLVFMFIPLMFCFCFRTLRSLDYLFLVVAFNGIVLGLSALFQYLGWYGLSYIEESRITGITNHPNELGAIAAMSFIFGVYLVIAGRKWFGLKLYGVASSVLSLVAVLLSSSFTALAVLVGVVFTAYFLMGGLTKFKTYMQIFVVMLVALIVFSLLSSDEETGYQLYSDRVSSVGEKSLGTRASTYSKAVGELRVSPFIGKGMAFEDRRIGDYQVHNMYLLSWYCAGILGLIGSIGTMLMPLFIYLSNRSRTYSRKDRVLMSCSLSAFVGCILVTMVAPNLYEITTYFPMFVWFSVATVLYKRNSSKLMVAK